MKLSSKTITAIKMFIDLGEHYEEGYISLVDIAKSPNEITLKDIIYISENGLSKENVGYAPIDDFLNQIDKHLEIYLEKKTLADLIEAAKESYSNNYCI